MKLSIGKFAEAREVGVETVRFYQRKGLLETPAPEGGIRRYGAEDLRRLRFIRKAKAAGFGLEEIRELIALDASQDRRRVHELTVSSIEALDAEIRILREARKSLQYLATQCNEGTPGPCPILKSFNV